MSACDLIAINYGQDQRLATSTFYQLISQTIGEPLEPSS